MPNIRNYPKVFIEYQTISKYIVPPATVLKLTSGCMGPIVTSVTSVVTSPLTAGCTRPQVMISPHYHNMNGDSDTDSDWAKPYNPVGRFLHLFPLSMNLPLFIQNFILNILNSRKDT